MLEPSGVLTALLLATGVGFIFEVKAGKEFDILNKVKDSRPVKVFRRADKDKRAEIMTIAKQDVVVGDIVYLQAGDKIPADCRVLTCQNLKIDESVLTGESNPAEKQVVILEQVCPLAEQKNMLFSGTSVVSGRGSAVVVRTALATEIGQIAEKLVQTQDEETPLKKRINKFSKQITFAVAFVCGCRDFSFISVRLLRIVCRQGFIKHQYIFMSSQRHSIRI